MVIDIAKPASGDLAHGPAVTAVCLGGVMKRGDTVVDNVDSAEGKFQGSAEGKFQGHYKFELLDRFVFEVLNADAFFHVTAPHTQVCGLRSSQKVHSNFRSSARFSVG